MAFGSDFRPDDYPLKRARHPDPVGRRAACPRGPLGFIPSFADWVKAIRPEPWMGRTEKIEALVDPHCVAVVTELR